MFTAEVTCHMVNKSINLVSGIILGPHPIIEQAGMMEHATSNAAGVRLIGYMYWGVKEVFTVEATGQKMGELEHQSGL